MHLQKIQCCNHTFTASDIQGPLMSQAQVFGKREHQLYGGNAKRFANTTCPECGKGYILWLKQQGQTWKVLTISEKIADGEKTEPASTTKRTYTRRT